MYSVIHGLNKAKSRDWMGKFLMTFLLYYDAGQAIQVADNIDSSKYWPSLINIARDRPSLMKRGTERRHMRGKNELNALERLSSFAQDPWGLLVTMYPPKGPHTPSYTNFYQHITENFSGTQFGPYFIWKLYDIFNVCLEMPIRMSGPEALLYMPAEPLKVLHTFADAWGGSPISTLERFNTYIGQYDHPVVRGQKCSYAETETILCMLKGYFFTKRHVIGDDIQEKWNQLLKYPEAQGYLPRMIIPNSYERGEFTV